MAIKADLLIDQGSTFSTSLNFTDESDNVISLVGYTASAQIRKWYNSANPSATFTAVVDAEAGSITISLTSEQTSALDAGRYVYDIEIDSGNVVTRLVEGMVTVTPQVTR